MQITSIWAKLTSDAPQFLRDSFPEGLPLASLEAKVKTDARNGFLFWEFKVDCAQFNPIQERDLREMMAEQFGLTQSDRPLKFGISCRHIKLIEIFGLEQPITLRLAPLPQVRKHPFKRRGV